MEHGKRRIRWRRFLIGLFLCYLAIIFVLIFYKGWGGTAFLRDNYASFAIWRESVSHSLNLIPFRFLFDAGGYTARAWIVNVCGNIALFIPMGVFVPVLFPKARAWRWRRIVLSAVLLIGMIELAQLLLLCGQGDIDDVILNAAGMCAGFARAKWSGAKRSRPDRPA